MVRVQETLSCPLSGAGLTPYLPVLMDKLYMSLAPSAVCERTYHCMMVHLLVYTSVHSHT